MQETQKNDRHPYFHCLEVEKILIKFKKQMSIYSKKMEINNLFLGC